MLFPHKAQLNKFMGFSKTGTPIYDAPVEIDCYFRPSFKVIENPNGQTIIQNAVVYTKTKIDVNDTVIFDGKKWPIIQSIHHIGVNLSYYKAVV